ncbi:2TM domain-containing protein [Flavobacterium sp. 20NA77.7]|uniref:2TM domain-containing protein n=1 Tax=Flavobacterium nakdongensis TaxID=3073563 RepID=A0ABY9RCL1_9FLAO|nr:2TM domain-containing protein [Flavobacterium sp. 20NA77.7]WMW78583.1 2TM domain-containing protein [Flavobacterium sp. 20NA77.7]
MEIIMETNQFDLKKYENAKKRVKELKGFYSHLASYILIISFLCFINFRFSPEHIWFYWPMLGWGIGLFFHAVGVFNIIPFFGKDWEDKKITEIMEKEKQTKWE